MSVTAGTDPTGLLSRPAELNRIVRYALLDRAEKCRKLAASRRMGGPDNGGMRAAMRVEAQACLDLAVKLQHDTVSAALLVAIAQSIKDGTS